MPQDGSEKDRDGRYFGACATNASADLNTDMINGGWAFVDRSGVMPVFSNYNKAETAAKQRRAGVWQGPMSLPWELSGNSEPQPPVAAENAVQPPAQNRGTADAHSSRHCPDDCRHRGGAGAVRYDLKWTWDGSFSPPVRSNVDQDYPSQIQANTAYRALRDDNPATTIDWRYLPIA